MKTTALVLLSGGMDSAAALWWARERHPRIVTLLFRIPGAAGAERRAARRISRAGGAAEHREVRLDFLAGGLKGRPSGYRPRRNLVYYAVAASVAEQVGADVLVGGHLATDREDFADARPGYFRRLAPAIGMKIALPFIRMTKPEVINYGRPRGVPFELSWSCFRAGPRPCGRCVSCRERAEAFLEAEKERP